MQRHNDTKPVLTAPDGSTKYLPSTLQRVGHELDQRVGREVAQRVDRHLAGGGHVFILHNQPITEGATS